MEVDCGSEEHEGAWQSDGTILCPDCDGGYTNLYTCVKIHETVHQKGKIDLIYNNF